MAGAKRRALGGKLLLGAFLAVFFPLRAAPAATVVLKEPVRFALGAAGEIVVPAGTRVEVERAGDVLDLSFGGGHASVAASQTDYAPPDAPVPPSAAAPRAEAPAALPAEAEAEGPCDALLANPRLPIHRAEREAIARDLVVRERWAAVGRLLDRALLSDTRPGDVDQRPWISRLRLAQACVWLETPEAAYAVAEIKRQARLRGPAPQGEEDRLVPAALADADKTKALASLFGDAENLPRPAILAKRLKPETLIALLANQELIDLLGETMTADDYPPGVWRVLADLQEHRPQGVAEFPNLAVALAVVYDQAFPADWPHAQVARDKVPFVWRNWNALFDYFIEAQHDGRLLADLGALSPAQLRFMVDIPLPRGELEWAQAHVHAFRPAFDKVFFSIAYDLERLHHGRFSWQAKDYRLERIAAIGGICVDQAYFAAMAGKAKGLPTLFFTGYGSFGGHAWFGYLREGGWFMDGGRYAAHNYVTGSARDPQDWEKITDHRLAFLSAPVESVTLYDYSRNFLALALLPAVRTDLPERQRLLAAALAVDPKLPEIWEAVAAALRELGQTDALRRHYRAMAEQFAGQDDLRVEALHALAEIEEEAHQPEAAEAARAQILAARSDLAIGEAAEIVQAKIIGADFKGAEARFEEFLALFVRRAKGEKVSPGDLFVRLVVPYAYALDEAGENALAVHAVAVAGPYFDLEGSQNLIAAYFRYLRAELALRAKKRGEAAGPSNDADIDPS